MINPPGPKFLVVIKMFFNVYPPLVNGFLLNILFCLIFSPYFCSGTQKISNYKKLISTMAVFYTLYRCIRTTARTSRVRVRVNGTPG